MWPRHSPSARLPVLASRAPETPATRALLSFPDVHLRVRVACPRLHGRRVLYVGHASVGASTARTCTKSAQRRAVRTHEAQSCWSPEAGPAARCARPAVCLGKVASAGPRPGHRNVAEAQGRSASFKTSKRSSARDSSFARCLEERRRSRDMRRAREVGEAPPRDWGRRLGRVR
jgi:hypothetical protein